MKSVKQLYKEIEELRSVMHDVAVLKGVNHPDTLKASMELDDKIVQYIKLIRQDIKEPPGSFLALPHRHDGIIG